MSDLDLEEISRDIKEQIDNAIVGKAESEPRKHLGASIIGHECKAYLWFNFRWAKLSQSWSPRMMRLFQRGHLEEARITAWLRDAGWTVEDLEPNGKQWRFAGAKGHFGGSRDGVAWHPEYSQLGKVLVEYKTHNTKQFVNLAQKGVALAMPKHKTQMDIYGWADNNQYGLYFPINKNDDSIAPELIKLDKRAAELSLKKAEDIIFSAHRPEKVSNNETFFTCKFCQYVAICHRGNSMDVSCRSCRFATPVEDGQWHCSRWLNIIPPDFIIKGCSDWQELEH